jgi:hypothetical protein
MFFPSSLYRLKYIFSLSFPPSPLPLSPPTRILYGRSQQFVLSLLFSALPLPSLFLSAWCVMDVVGPGDLSYRIRVLARFHSRLEHELAVQLRNTTTIMTLAIITLSRGDSSNHDAVIHSSDHDSKCPIVCRCACSCDVSCLRHAQCMTLLRISKMRTLPS